MQIKDKYPIPGQKEPHKMKEQDQFHKFLFAFIYIEFTFFFVNNVKMYEKKEEKSRKEVERRRYILAQ